MTIDYRLFFIDYFNDYYFNGYFKFNDYNGYLNDYLNDYFDDDQIILMIINEYYCIRYTTLDIEMKASMQIGVERARLITVLRHLRARVDDHLDDLQAQHSTLARLALKVKRCFRFVSFSFFSFLCSSFFSFFSFSTVAHFFCCLPFFFFPPSVYFVFVFLF